MKDPKADLLKAYFDLLDGNITFGGNTIKVYDVNGVPQEPDYPHILLTDFTQIDESDKTVFAEEITFDIEVIDRARQRASRSGVFSIVNQIKGIVRVRPEAFSITDWNIYNTILDTEITIPKEFDGSYIYFGSRITFRHSAEQL